MVDLSDSPIKLLVEAIIAIIILTILIAILTNTQIIVGGFGV